eukprot:GHVU01195772.1.p1 GENE.GHVU01195772.1~~GHVU01195772.1.p1  ORF type:complete len:121 (+),score=8.07 GHVU01195772.1:623-985(+)
MNRQFIISYLIIINWWHNVCMHGSIRSVGEPNVQRQRMVHRVARVSHLLNLFDDRSAGLVGMDESVTTGEEVLRAVSNEDDCKNSRHYIVKQGDGSWATLRKATNIGFVLNIICGNGEGE